MARRPKPTCQICKQQFERPYAKGRIPDYCPTCRESGKTRLPRGTKVGYKTCPRCNDKFVPLHPAQRYCPDLPNKASCRWGCKQCGQPVRDKQPGQQRKEDYCSRECRDKAWENVPLPICYFCKEPVELPVNKGQARKDPPKAHRACYMKHNAPKETKDA